MAPADSTVYETVSEVARRYRTDTSAIVRWIQHGVADPRTPGHRIRPVGCIRTPGRWLIPVGSIERYLAEVTAARRGESTPVQTIDTPSRERELARIEAELSAAGL